MKSFRAILFGLFLGTGALIVRACPYENELVYAIYRAEGGERARVPYGVLSVSIRDKKHAEQITRNSIRNNWERWGLIGHKGSFVEFMARRWVPENVDRQGHKNWVKNVRFFLRKQGIEA